MSSSLKFLGMLCFVGLLLLSACTPDACHKVDCLNGGECSEGACACVAGYEGLACETTMSSKFIGTYSLTETCVPSGPAGPYSVVISGRQALAEISLVGLYGTQVGAITATIGSDGTSFSIARQAILSNTEIESTNGNISADGQSISLSYTVYQVNPAATADVCTAVLTR
jgi:hypothetical protein